MKSTASSRSQRTNRAHDTLQQLSFAKRPGFNALWQPKDLVNINVKAVDRRRILGDEHLESIIKDRPRTYVAPSVSLDDVQNKDERKLMIDFIYKTTNQAANEVWSDFEVESSCSLKKRGEQEKPLMDQQVVSRLPAKFRGAARKWDSVQSRSFLAGDTCYDKKDKTRKVNQSEIRADEERLEKERTIRKLINENKLSIVYDKLPSSYTGHRPYFAYGMPLEKKEIRSVD